jgi:hypothetical protein
MNNTHIKFLNYIPVIEKNLAWRLKLHPETATLFPGHYNSYDSYTCWQGYGVNAYSKKFSVAKFAWRNRGELTSEYLPRNWAMNLLKLQETSSATIIPTKTHFEKMQASILE